MCFVTYIFKNLETYSLSKVVTNIGCVGFCVICIGETFLDIIVIIRLTHQKISKSIHIWSESNHDNFSIPQVLITVLWSSQVAKSNGTIGGPQIKNVPFQKFQ